MAKKSGSKPMTKTEIMRSISETTNLPKKDVVAVLESLTTEIQKALKGLGVKEGSISVAGPYDAAVLSTFNGCALVMPFRA
jgi:hypothetical protein